MPERRPGYYAVIPADVRYDEQLKPNAKLLYGEISALIGMDGFCFAGNGYFAELYGLTERTVSDLISKLQKRDYIRLEFERDDSGQILNRKIYLKVSAPEEQPLEENFHTYGKNLPEGIEENFQYTKLNNTDICKENKKESGKKKNSSPRTPPKTDFEPLPSFTAWIAGTFPDRAPDEKNALYLALNRFLENRIAIKKPMKSQGAVTSLTNKLKKYAGSNIPAMIDLLDTATLNGWQSVFPQKDGTAQVTTPAQNGRVKEWL